MEKEILLVQESFSLTTLEYDFGLCLNNCVKIV